MDALPVLLGVAWTPTALREQLVAAVGEDTAAAAVRILLLVVVGMPLAWLLARAVGGVARRQLGANTAVTIRRFAWYALAIAVLASILRELGFDLSVLLGAAGILTVALGFASQTSASNIISGLFLLGERPFEPGDTIEVEGTVGIVLAIDLLSVKLRTFDNLFVRVPNETLVKARIVNRSRHPIRRIDLRVGVAYDSDMDRVRAVLARVADEEPLVLQDPAPVFQVLGFLDSAVDVQFSAWVAAADFVPTRTLLHEHVLAAFRAEGIEIPFPQRVVSHRTAGPAAPEAPERG